MRALITIHATAKLWLAVLRTAVAVVQTGKTPALGLIAVRGGGILAIGVAGTGRAFGNALILVVAHQTGSAMTVFSTGHTDAGGCQAIRGLAGALLVIGAGILRNTHPFEHDALIASWAIGAGAAWSTWSANSFQTDVATRALTDVGAENVFFFLSSVGIDAGIGGFRPSATGRQAEKDPHNRQAPAEHLYLARPPIRVLVGKAPLASAK